MSVTISLPPETEAKLQSRASAAGEDLCSFVSKLLARVAESPIPMEELSGPIYQSFLESGMSDDELGDLLEKAKHEMRQERRPEQAFVIAPASFRCVFDCNIFAQALINPRGPAAACIAAAQIRRVSLFISDYIIAEIRELPSKLPACLRVSDERVDRLLLDLAAYTIRIGLVPRVFEYDRDPNDAPYVDLAVAAGARYIVTRDKDLLDLMDVAKPNGVDFRAKFPGLGVFEPLSFLNELKKLDSEET